MEKHRNPIVLWLSAILTVLLCNCLILSCLGGAAVFSLRKRTQQPIRLGYDFRGRQVSTPGGDISAGGHIFIHLYPMPVDGTLTGLEYANDCEANGVEQREEIFVLVLRPVSGGYQVIFRQELLPDDINPVCDGINRFEFATPLPVLRGDLLAHWQPGIQSGGPIPMNIDSAVVEGRTYGKAGFSFDNTNVGSFISSDGFGGSRDYFMVGLFDPSE
jgi:hypothetical protein